MTSSSVLTISRYQHQHAAEVRSTLLDVYAEVYAEEIATQPFFSLDAFSARLDRHTANPGWACTIGRVGTEVAGYAYGRPDSESDWCDVTDATEDVSGLGVGTFGLCEIMVRELYRGTGVARALHDELMTGRPEVRASLLVDESHPRVRDTYRRWGYRTVARLRPSAEAPQYEAMVLDLG
jgi:ribosomal protein S18 acetylase RimI-like enzyme